MAKILLAFFNGILDSSKPHAIPCFYESFIKGFSDSGNEVLAFPHYKFGDDFGCIPNAILQKIKEFDPDVIIIFNNNFYDISDFFDCPIIIYEVDSPLFFGNKDNIRNKPDRYLFFAAQTDSIEVIHDLFNVHTKNIYWLPFFSEVRTEKKNILQNIAFIGTNFTNFNIIQLFLQTYPNEEEIRQYKKILLEVKKNPFVASTELINTYDIKSEKVINHLQIDKIIGILSSTSRIHALSQVSDLGLTIFGTRSWTDLIYEPDLQFCYNATPVYSLAHNQNIYNSSRICLNINHVQAKSGFSWRVCDIMASNACLISEFKSDFKRLFHGIPIPFFSNRYEAREQCIKILSDEKLRQDIVLQCNEIINKKYRFKHLLRKIEGILGLNLRNNTDLSSITVSYDSEYVDTKLKVDIICENNINANGKSFFKKIKRKIKLFLLVLILFFSLIPFLKKIISSNKVVEQIKRRL